MTTSYLAPGARDAVADGSRQPVHGDRSKEHGHLMAQESMVPSRATLASRNISVGGRRTSVRLEPDMWKTLHQIADREKCTIHEVCSLVALRKDPDTSLTAALRVFLMLYYKAAATEEGHLRAGHGDIARMRERAEAPNQLAFTQAARPAKAPGTEP